MYAFEDARDRHDGRGTNAVTGQAVLLADSEPQFSPIPKFEIELGLSSASISESVQARQL